MDKRCFAYDLPVKRCIALSDTGSCGTGCPFFQSRAEYAAACRRAYRRLAGLPEVHQQHIAETYYDGERPWREMAGRRG